MPRPEAPWLFFFDKRVSVDNDVSKGDILCFSFFAALGSVGVLVTNGDGTLGDFGVGGEDLRASWTGESPS